MASIGSFIGKFFGRTASEAAGVAAGITVSRPLAPLAQNVENEFWAAAVQLGFKRPLDPNTSAQIVAQRLWKLTEGQDEAALTGRNRGQFDALVTAVMTAPGTAEALELWRRKRIDKTQMVHALHKAGLEQQYIEPVLELFGERLAPAEIANAVQQGFLANENLLPPATAPNPNWTPADGPIRIPVERVALTDQEGNAVTTKGEAEASGIDAARLKVLAELVGLPPGEETLIDLWRRGIIDDTDYETGLREGHTKTKWTAALAARFFQLLPPSVLVNLRLRGWIDAPDYHSRMRLHGYRPQQADDWYDSSGRPATTHQALVGTRRGGIYDGPLTGIPDYFVKAVRQSNIKPEWTHILYHGRETFPSAFVLRLLTTRGDITGAQAHDLLYQNGWPDWLATAASSAWAGTTAGVPTAPEVKSAHTRALTLLRNAYVARRVDDAFATDRLTALGIDAAVQGPLLDAWRIMQTIPGAGLTRAQVKKAFKSLPAEWPRDRALTELEDLGMEPEEAQTYLDE